MESNRTCPECHLVFEAPLSETGVLACPLCNTVFATAAPVVPVVTSAAPVASGRQVLRGVAAVGAVLCLTAGMGYAYHLLNDIDHKAAAVPAATAHAPPEPPSPPLVEYASLIPIEPMPPATIPRQPRPPERQPPTIVEKPQRPLTLPERINAAIDRGRAYLQSNYHEFPQYYRNNLGLLGLTLLECGVAADDPSVRQIAARIRSPERQITQAYQLTLAIFFLDRLGDPRDSALIRSFGQRLLWGHNPARQRIAYQGANSGTQYAILGLWVARRHGLSVNSALLATEQYFRNTQNDDGSWALSPKTSRWRDSMTCAGLMSLALSHGVSAGQGRDIRLKRPIVVRDAAIQRGLRYLAQSLDNMTVAGNGTIRVEARNFLDFLWSLERMAVIYDLKKIGEREWYPWAAQRLVDTQWGDGRIPGTGNTYQSTCLALLVLKRSNFAKDLQLTVQEQPLPLMPERTGRTILQGRDAFLGQTRKRLTTNPKATNKMGERG
ncbi:MAG: hypothetical protein ACRELG_20595, partial [Gemmataceae bacterium]